MKQRKGLLLASPILIFLFILSASTDARQCKLTCAGGSGNILKFQPGKTYQYKLEGNSITTLPGAKNEVSKVGIEANVEVSAAKDCEHVLTVSGVHTIAPDGQKYSVDNILGSNLLKFGLQNGKIVDLCASQTEKPNALNVKRAILSLLQSSVLKDSGYALQHETDVFGSCPTNFEFSKQGGSVLVKKSKDLLKCAHREELNLPYSTSSYFIKSDLQTSPLLLGTYSSEQKFDGGILKSAQSEEHYSYNPATAVESITKIEVITKLNFVGQTDKPCPVANVNEGKSLIFEGGHPGDYKGGVQTMVELLKVSCDSRSIDKEGASKYNQLVRVVADAPKDDLLKVYQQVKSGQGFKEKDIAKKLFLDALAAAGSSGSVEVLAKILKDKEVSGAKAAYYHMLLGSIKHATKETLLAVLPLIDDSASVELYLGAGALGGRFCREHNCANFPEVEAFQIKLGSPLLTKGCKPANKREEDKLIASLKGLANMGYLANVVVKKLADNVGDSSVKSRVRAALLDTIRSDAHKPEFKKVAGEIFKNPEEDSEIRIKAYLVLAACPCGKVAALVKSVLENEKSFQVGGFVVSHLRNLRASTNPEKASARHHLGSIVLTPRFPIDPRKYSQNQELSYSVDMLNLGAAGESNLIYSQKSYIPRSVSLNLTSYMFGHAFNWLEIDLRSENLERALESLFGPRGKLRKHKYHEVYDELREEATNNIEKFAERYEETIRPKRSITRDQLNALANKVNLHQEEDEIDVDLSLKMYGAERLWLRYHSNENKIDSDRIVDFIFSATDDTLKSAKNLKFDYRKHLTFLDEEVLYPTGLGLPLKVKAIGSTAYRVKVDGKIDIPALVKDPSNSDVRLQVIPSAAIEVRGDIVLGAIAFEGGVKVTLNLHTSTGSDVTFRVIDGHGVDVKFGLPVKKQDIISISTDVNTVIRHDNSPEKNIPIAFDVKREKYSGCFDQLNEVLGVTVCGEVDVPWDGPRSLSPAYGPSKLSLHVDKDDDSLTIYHFKIFADDTDGVRKFEVLFDTPNSRVNRKMLLLLEGSLAEKKYGIISLKSPWTNVLLESSLVHTSKELSINAKFVHDEVEYAFRTGATKSVQGNVERYEPILEYKAPEQAKSALVGRRGGPKPSSQVVTVSGAVVVTSNENGKTWKYESLSVHTPRTKYTIDGTGSATKYGGDIDVVVHYDQEHVKIKGQVNEKDNKLNIQLTVLPSQYPDFNLNIKLDAVKDVDHGKCDTTLIVIHGPDPNSATNKIYLHNAIEINKKEGIYSIDNAVSYPVVNLDVHAALRVAPKSFKTDLKGQFDRYSAQVYGKLDYNTKKEGDYNGELKWELMGNSVALIMSRNVLKNHQSKFANVLEIKPGGKYELNAQVKHKFSEKDIDFLSDVELVLPAEPKNIKIKVLLKNNEVETKAQLNAVAGNKQYIKTDFNLKSGDKPSGNYKVNILEHLNANGDFLYDGSNLKAKTKIDLPKAQRQMEGKANFVVTKTKVSGSADFCWDTKNNAEKTLKITTDSSLLENSVDSKNSLTIGGKKTVLNLKGSKTGEEQKGSAAGEVELILSCGDRIKLKASDKRDLSNENNINGEALVELEVQQKKEGLTTVAVKLVGKNIDMEHQNFDGLLELIIGRDDQKSKAHIILKKIPKGSDRITLKGELNLNAFVDPELVIKFDSEVPTELFDDDLSLSSKELDSLPPVTYHISLSGGPDVQIQANGKLGGNIANAELSAKLPEESAIRSLKWSSTNLIDINGDDKHKIKSNNELHWNGDNFVKVSGECNCEGNGLSYSAEWESNKLSKRKLTGSAHWAEDANTKKADANAALSWEGKNADISLKVEQNNENVGSIHILGNTPDQGKFDFLLKNKVVNNGEGLHTDLVLITKDKKIAVSSKLELNQQHPMIDVVVDSPNGKSRLLIKVDHKGERHWASEIKAKFSGERSVTLSVDSEIYLNSVENFFITHTVDAPQMNIRKMQIELSNKPGRSDGKKITFIIKQEDKITVSASSNYVIRHDGNENIIEGTGTIKAHDQQFPISFKGNWIDTDDQKAAKLLVKFNKKTVHVEFKRTENELNFEREICEEGGKCSKAQFLNRVRSSGLDDYDHTVVLQLDLGQLRGDIFVKDVYYAGSYKRKGQTVDHSVEAKYGDQTKFKYKGYIHEKDAGILITLPKRTVGADVIYDVDVNKDQSSGSVKLEANLYINKETNDKLCFISNSNIENNKNNLKFNSETKLTHPSLRRDLVVRGNINGNENDVKGEFVIDVFKHSDQKIIIDFKKSYTAKPYKTSTTVNVKSESCKLDIKYENQGSVSDDGAIYYADKVSYLDSLGATRTAKVVYELNSKKQYLLVKLPQGKLMEVDAVIDLNDKGMKVNANYLVGKLNFQESLNYNKENNLAVYQLKWADHVIDGEFSLLMTKSASFKLRLDNKECAHAQVALDEANFLKTDYKYDPDVVKNALQIIGEIYEEEGEQIAIELKKNMEKEEVQLQHFVKCLTECVPEFSALSNHFKNEMKSLKDDTMADTDLTNIMEQLEDAFGTFFKQISVILDELTLLGTTTSEFIAEITEKCSQILKEVWPKLSDALDKFGKSLTTLLEQYLKVLLQVFNEFFENLKKYKEDVDAVLGVYSDVLHEIGKQFASVIYILHDEIQKFVKLNLEQLNEMPITNMLKEKLDELKEWRIPEEALLVYQEVIDSLKQFLPTPECEDFITALSEYLTKVVKQEPVDSAEAAKDIYDKLVNAIKSLVTRINEITPKQAAFKPEQYLTLPITSWLKLPLGSVRVSIINLIRSQDFPVILGSLDTYALSLNPLQNIPPFEGIAQIIDGTEIITFDNRHYHIKGMCSYVLAEDYVNRNFSIVGHFKDGKLEAVTAWDHNHSITLRKDGPPLKDGLEAEYPLKVGLLKAWKSPYSVGLKTKAGVVIHCTPNVDSCTFIVSGFYFNKLRGLLGNLNYEQFDDLYLPQGNVGSDPAQLCNSWKVDNSCPDIPIAPHTHQRQQICTSLFASDDSDLILGRPWLSLAPYRDACDHLVEEASGNKQKVACKVATLFTVHAQMLGAYLLEIPSECILCDINDKKINDDETVEVTPGKSADIVFLVDVNKRNEHVYKGLVQPLVPQLKAQLAKQQINDIRVVLASYNSPSDKWTNYHTVMGKLEFGGADCQIHFEDSIELRNETWVDRLLEIKHDLDIAIGNTAQLKAYESILEMFDFRPNALKAIISVHSEACETESPLQIIAPIRAFTDAFLSKDAGIVWSIITPINSLATDAKAGIISNDITCFSSGEMYTLDKTVDGDADYESDYCIRGALATGGVIVPSINFMDNYRGGKSGPFIQKTAERLSIALQTNGKATLECDCGTLHGLVPKPDCELEKF
uniref:Venom apolipophorin-like protein 1 n=1 Tax=Pristhesancus plagipennis TaxID=1955184 RepID=A0A2K8JWD4_PRIPG|nr:venom apolipophorin-like protein 1 [Pristhesancus plagipennis]